MKAFANENELKALLYKKFKFKELKMVKLPLQRYKVETIIDFEIEFEGKIYLFDVDSYNSPKVIFGQYLLINRYFETHENYLYVPIHFNKNYKIIHSFNHLQYAFDKMKCGIAFKIFDEPNFKALIKKSKNVTDFFKLIDAHHALIDK